jgi:hypothetical protein
MVLTTSIKRLRFFTLIFAVFLAVGRKHAVGLRVPASIIFGYSLKVNTHNAGLILSLESNQNVESKTQMWSPKFEYVESNIRLN